VKKVLIIDDEEYFCRALKKNLELKAVCRALAATTGEEGIRLARAEKPDLILLDIMMPGLLANPATSSIPIIFVTAIINKEDVRRNAGQIGGRTFLAKPVKIEDLIEKINAL